MISLLNMHENANLFGKRLGDHQGVGFMLADNEMDIFNNSISRSLLCAGF